MCSSLPAPTCRLAQPRDRHPLRPTREHTTVLLATSVYFPREGLEGLDGSCGVLGPPASHLAFGLRNLRPAKTALSPRASSILGDRQSQSCAFQPNSPGLPTSGPPEPPVPHELVVLGQAL